MRASVNQRICWRTTPRERRYRVTTAASDTIGAIRNRVICPTAASHPMTPGARDGSVSVGSLGSVKSGVRAIALVATAKATPIRTKTAIGRQRGEGRRPSGNRSGIPHSIRAFPGIQSHRPSQAARPTAGRLPGADRPMLAYSSNRKVSPNDQAATRKMAPIGLPGTRAWSSAPTIAYTVPTTSRSRLKLPTRGSPSTTMRPSAATVTATQPAAAG
jgi:hypothetical protein